jgi:inorganic phosphate transporter, PiT family
LRNWKPRTVNAVFGKAQIFSAISMGLMHGTNDAQKTMGIVALALASGTAAGRLANLPGWLSFLQVATPQPGQNLTIALWIKVMCALVMAAGTAAGGWRIIRTLGHKMVHLQPVNGFAAETSSAAIIGLASHFGIPVSTTHNVSASIMGVGVAKRFSALKWTIVERMAWAWLLTIPVAATIAYWLMRLLQALGYAE